MRAHEGGRGGGLERHPFDPDGSRMLVSETKPCKSKYTSVHGGNCERLIKPVTIHSAFVRPDNRSNSRANTCEGPEAARRRAYSPETEPTRGPSGDRRPRDRVNHGEPTDRRPRAGDPPNEFLTYQPSTVG
jgi:hypothetical protein